jgi:hypothetical protein
MAKTLTPSKPVHLEDTPACIEATREYRAIRDERGKIATSLGELQARDREVLAKHAEALRIAALKGTPLPQAPPPNYATREHAQRVALLDQAQGQAHARLMSAIEVESRRILAEERAIRLDLARRQLASMQALLAASQAQSDFIDGLAARGVDVSLAEWPWVARPDQVAASIHTFKDFVATFMGEQLT